MNTPALPPLEACQPGGATIAVPIEASQEVTIAGPLDWLLLLSPGLIWGASFLFIAEGLEAVGPHGVAFVRIAIGWITLATLPASRSRLPRSAWPLIALLAVVWFALPLSLFPFAEQRVSSAVTGMLNGAVPLFAAVVAIAVSRRAPSPTMLASLVIGLGGSVLVAWPTLREGHTSATGVALILVAVTSYGIAIHVARPLQQAYGALPVLFRALSVAVILTAPLGVVDVARAAWTPAAILSLGALGMLGTGLAYVLAATAAGRFGATRASATAFVIPLVALTLGTTVRAERVALVALLGALLSLVGVALLRRTHH